MRPLRLSTLTAAAQVTSQSRRKRGRVPALTWASPGADVGSSPNVRLEAAAGVNLRELRTQSTNHPRIQVPGLRREPYQLPSIPEN